MNNKHKRAILTITFALALTALATSFSYAQEPASESTTGIVTATGDVTADSTAASDQALDTLSQDAVLDAATAANPTTAIDEAPAAPEDAPTPINDPLEKINRPIFAFNDGLDHLIVKPVAQFYNKIMPKPLNEGIHNFFNNLGEITTIANDILQLNFYQTTNDTWRFLVNSTVGIGGLFDVASRIGLKYYANDFGLTLAKYGWKNSTYVVLPFFGPNTFRDTIELPVDYFAFSIYPYVQPDSTRYQLYALGIVDRRAQLLQFQSVLEEVAIDKYVFMRNAYMQRRNYQIKENQNLGFRGAQGTEQSETDDEQQQT